MRKLGAHLIIKVLPPHTNASGLNLSENYWHKTASLNLWVLRIHLYEGQNRQHSSVWWRWVYFPLEGVGSYYWRGGHGNLWGTDSTLHLVLGGAYMEEDVKSYQASYFIHTFFMQLCQVTMDKLYLDFLKICMRKWTRHVGLYLEDIHIKSQCNTTLHPTEILVNAAICALHTRLCFHCSPGPFLGQQLPRRRLPCLYRTTHPLSFLNTSHAEWLLKPPLIKTQPTWEVMLPLFMTPHPHYFLSNPTALWVTCQRSRKHALTSPSSYSHWPLSSVRLLLRPRHTKQSNDTYPLTHSSKKMIERGGSTGRVRMVVPRTQHWSWSHKAPQTEQLPRHTTSGEAHKRSLSPRRPPSCQLEPRERSTLSKARSRNVSTAERQRGSRAERVRTPGHPKPHERLQALGDQQVFTSAVSSMKLNKPQRETYGTQSENSPGSVSSLKIRDSTREIRLSSYCLQIHQSSTQCPLRPKTQLSFLQNSPPWHPAKPPEKRKWGLRKDKWQHPS